MPSIIYERERHFTLIIVYHISSDLLIIVAEIHCHQGHETNGSGNLQDASSYPISLDIPDLAIHAPGEYGPGIVSIESFGNHYSSGDRRMGERSSLACLDHGIQSIRSRSTK
jgi:hypothetical protein